MNHHEQRRQLAAGLRWAARLGWQSGICNHFSLAVDADENSQEGVLINPQGYHWSEVTASSLLLLDSQGALLEGEGTVEDTAFFIHCAIHQQIPSARCVLHAHPPHSTAIMCTKKGRLLNIHQDSLRFHKRIAYDDNFGGVAGNTSEGLRIARAMRDRPIMMMAHHGVTVTGSTVAEALDSFYYLEVAARFQILAASTGDELRVMSEETADRLAPGFQLLNEQTTGHFSAIRRILDREEPGYST